MDLDARDVDEVPLWLVVRASHLAERRISAALTGLGLTPVQFGVLAQLAAAGPLTQAELARRVEVRPQTAAGVVATMIDHRLLVRSSSPAKGQRNPLQPTARGDEVFARAWRSVGQANSAGALGLEPEELDELRRLLSVLLAADSDTHLPPR